MNKNIFQLITESMNNPDNKHLMALLRNGQSIKLPIKMPTELPDKTQIWCHWHIDLEPEDVLVSAHSNSDWAVKSQDGITIAIDTNLTDDLILKGRRNDLVRSIQNLRKKSNLYMTDRIDIEMSVSYEDIVKEYGAYIKVECLVDNIILSDTDEIILTKK